MSTSAVETNAQLGPVGRTDSRPKRFKGTTPPPPRKRWEDPVPKDWRWFVGGLGKCLITLGLLIFGFVAYQLWGTGIQYSQRQKNLGRELAQQFDAAPSGFVPAITIGPPTSTTVAAPSESVPASTTTTEPPVTVPAFPSNIDLGKGLGYIQIPKMGLNDILIAGVRVDDLKSGVGHFPETPVPGQLGNAALAGHRTTFGAPFSNIDKLVPGDEIIIATVQGKYVYRVTGTTIHKPSDYDVVANVPDKAMLTLISCHPKATAKQRIVVTADLDAAASSPLAPPVFNYGHNDLAASADGLAAEEAGTTQAPATTGPAPSNGVPDQAVDVSTAPQAPPTVPAAPATTVPQTETADAFGAGWFSDPYAIPDVVFWGMACAVVSLLAAWLSRRTNRIVGVAAWVLPFVVALYFFYENANRLLPPNL